MPLPKPPQTRIPQQTQVTRLVRVARAARVLLDRDGDFIEDSGETAIREFEDAMRDLRPSDFDDQRSFYPPPGPES